MLCYRTYLVANVKKMGGHFHGMTGRKMSGVRLLSQALHCVHYVQVNSDPLITEAFLTSNQQ